jgi:GT2 family glycosyltransferase
LSDPEAQGGGQAPCSGEWLWYHAAEMMRAADAPLVVVVLLNWNGAEDTIACVMACHALTWPNARVVIVDNGSTDGSEARLRDRLPDIEIIQSGANLGFAGGSNVGIRRALELGAEYVWLLNNDAVPDPSALTELVDCMQRTPAVAIAGSLIYYHDDPKRLWFAGGMWEKGRLRLRHAGAGTVDRGQWGAPQDTGSVSGCSLLARSSQVRAIGLLAERFFLYWEDTEWCARAQQAGKRVVLVPRSRVWHKVSSSTGQRSVLQYAYFTRNGLYFLREHDRLLVPLFFAQTTAFAVYCLLSGDSRPLRGFAR